MSFFAETWTVNKIVECFPITEEACRKLLKSKWAPHSLEQLARHDDRVMENWKMLSKMNPDIEGQIYCMLKESFNFNAHNIPVL